MPDCTTCNSIRKARRQDYPALVDLFSQIDALHRQALPHLFQEARGPSRTRTYIERILDDDDAALLVAEREDRLVGAIHVLLHEALGIPILTPRRYAVIDTLVVDSTCRRSGVGQALMAEAETWARTKGAQAIELTVWEFNQDAAAFYRTLGYETINRRMWKPVEPET